MSSKENWKYYQDRGRCPKCGGANIPKAGNLICEACNARTRARSKKRYDERKAAGLCVKCGGVPVEGRVLCADCAAKQRTYDKKGRAKKTYDERLEAGKCVKCGIAYAEFLHVMCRKCAAKAKMYKMRRDKDADKAKRDQVLQYRRENHLCIDCGRPAADGCVRCEKCLATHRDRMRNKRILARMDAEAAQARARGRAM